MVEFALVLPVLIAVLLLIVGFARVMNEYNDLNQMAADGARMAAVGNLPDPSVLQASGDTPLSKKANITATYAAPGSSTFGATCAVGGTVKVTATGDLNLIPFSTFINTTIPGFPSLTGTAEMRVERC